MQKKKEPKVVPGPLGWGWVRLSELAEIIGQSAKGAWFNFFGLTKDIQDNVLAWSPDLEELIQDGTEPEDFTSAYVPAGWAQDVLRAHELGAVRVRLEVHEHRSPLDGCPDGSLTCYPCGLDSVSAVGVRADGTPVDACEHPAPERRSGGCLECARAGQVLPEHRLCRVLSEQEVRDVEEGRAQLLLDQKYGLQLVYWDE